MSCIARRVLIVMSSASAAPREEEAEDEDEDEDEEGAEGEKEDARAATGVPCCAPPAMTGATAVKSMDADSAPDATVGRGLGTDLNSV